MLARPDRVPCALLGTFGGGGAHKAGVCNRHQRIPVCTLGARDSIVANARTHIRAGIIIKRRAVPVLMCRAAVPISLRISVLRRKRCAQLAPTATSIFFCAYDRRGTDRQPGPARPGPALNSQVGGVGLPCLCGWVKSSFAAFATPGWLGVCVYNSRHAAAVPPKVRCSLRRRRRQRQREPKFITGSKPN